MAVITANAETHLRELLRKVLSKQAAEAVTTRFASQPELMLGARPSTEEELAEHIEYIADEFDRVVAPELQQTNTDSDQIKQRFLRTVHKELSTDVVADDDTSITKGGILDSTNQIECLASGDERIQILAAHIIGDSALITGEATTNGEIIERLVTLLETEQNKSIRHAAARALCDISRENPEWAFSHSKTVLSETSSSSQKIQRELLYVCLQMVKACDPSIAELDEAQKNSIFRVVATAADCLRSEDQETAQRAAEIINVASEKNTRFVMDVVQTLCQHQSEPDPIIADKLSSTLYRLRKDNTIDLDEEVNGIKPAGPEGRQWQIGEPKSQDVNKRKGTESDGYSWEFPVKAGSESDTNDKRHTKSRLENVESS